MNLRRWFLRTAAILAWALAAGLVVVTWGPQSLRPHAGDPSLERFGAFFITAAMFVLAYPRHAGRVALSGVAFAIVLELGQLIAPGRDAGIPDVIAKALGGLAGVLATVLFLRVWVMKTLRSER